MKSWNKLSLSFNLLSHPTNPSTFRGWMGYHLASYQ